jgi:hypothetical protein
MATGVCMQKIKKPNYFTGFAISYKKESAPRRNHKRYMNKQINTKPFKT